MERNRPRYEGNYSRGRTHGGRFRSGRANLNQPNYNHQQQDGMTDKFPSYTQQSPNSSFPRQRNNLRPSSSYQNSGESQGPSNNFINNSNKYRGQGHEKPNFASLDTSAVLTNTDLEEKDSQYGPFLTGTCTDMCPAKERTQREKLRDLAVFERLDGNPHKTSAKLAVKKFCRTISMSEIQTSDIRPLPVLLTAMEYLLELIDTSEHAFAVVHNFVFDRTRAIRQELMMQNITSHEAIIMHEQMVRFHILSQHKLYQLSSNRDTSMLHLNFEQLSKCLRSLLDLYNTNMKSFSEARCQAEFCSYYVLVNMRSCSLPQTVRPTLLKSKEMKFARNVLRCYRMGNFKGFFTLAREATYLEACLMECYFNEVRAQAVACINHGSYKLSPFPLCDLAELLIMNESDMEHFCSVCGLATSTDDRGFKSLNVRFHILSQHKLYQLSSNRDTSMLHLNFEQLSKCLRSLLDLYNTNMKSFSEARCQAEFCSYYVLVNMRSCSLPQVLSYGNFKGFFTLASEATYLEACLMECCFNEVCAQAVACINHGSYKLSPFPLCDLAELRIMNESDMEDFCSVCGLATSTDDRGF